MKQQLNRAKLLGLTLIAIVIAVPICILLIFSSHMYLEIEIITSAIVATCLTTAYIRIVKSKKGAILYLEEYAIIRSIDYGIIIGLLTLANNYNNQMAWFIIIIFSSGIITLQRITTWRILKVRPDIVFVEIGNQK